MTPDQVVAHYKTVAAAARAAKVKGPSFYGWIKDGRIPIDRQCQYEVLTGGALVADRDELDVTPRGNGAESPTEERVTP